MKRSPSSCLRAGERPDVSSSSTSPSSHHNANKRQQSVTILHTETLPTYSCERFYMLSEIEMNAPPVVFLSAVEEEETTTVDTEKEEEEVSTSTFPPFIIFYIFWKPTDEQNVDTFVNKTLRSKINRLKQHVEFAPFDQVADRVLKSSNEQQQQPITTTNTTENKPHCCVYLVVDRIPPPTVSTQNNTPDTAAEQLARAVATDALFRDTIQGITVGVSNHVRAAPGLEACHDAIGLGAKDRRKIATPVATNFLGIVAECSDDLLGLQDSNECDGAEGVEQSKVSAEYNGRGNLQSYAMNAHGVWRQRHGLPPPKITQRRTPRRIRRLPVKNSRETEFLVYDTIAALVLLFYVCFHSGHLLFPKE